MKKRILIYALLVSLIVVAATGVHAKNCMDEVTAMSTQELLDEIPTLNAKLSTCNSNVPFPFRSEVIAVKIFMQDGTTEEFSVTTRKGKIIHVAVGSVADADFVVTLGECELDTIMRSKNLGHVAHIFLAKKMDIKAQGFFNRLKFLPTKAFIKRVFKKVEKPTTIECS